MGGDGGGQSQEAGKGKRTFSPGASRKDGVLQTFRFNPQESAGTVLSHRVYGMLLHQPQEMVQPISQRSRLRPREKGLAQAHSLWHRQVSDSLPGASGPARPSSLGDRA